MSKKVFTCSGLTALLLAFGIFSVAAVYADDSADDSIKIKGIVKERPSLAEVKGAKATLKITEDGIQVKVKTKELVPGNAHTMWWLIDQVGSPAPEFVMWAAGGIVDKNGKLKLEASLETGAVVPEVNGATVRRNRVLDGIFTNATTQVIWNVLVDHGPVQVSMGGAQTGTRGGGCTEGTSGGGTIADPFTGPIGESICAGVQEVRYP